MVTIRDAETRLKIESQLQVSQRLAAIGRLTGGVAHEIKNPLNAISVHLEILKSKLAGVEVADDIDSIAVIGRELARLDRVVKTFLDFTKPVELHMAEVDLVPMLRELTLLVAPQADRLKIGVDVECGLDRGVIHGDRDLLSQAVLNVAMNGIEAMPRGGRIRIQLSQEDDTYVLAVADEGDGIPANVRNKIFNLYFTTKERGSGIGLAATFRIVQLHNATIEFASEVGQGTTFTFRFPAASRITLDRAVQTAQRA
jgi:signal transduction histidine kinase